jgi:hypothetical protein
MSRSTAQDSPDLLISFLRYALDDVRALSERSSRQLELAIATLTEDTSIIEIGKAMNSPRHPS